MDVQPATVQRILRHSSITVAPGTNVEVIEAVQRDALDSMGTCSNRVATIRHTGCRQRSRGCYHGCPKRLNRAS